MEFATDHRKIAGSPEPSRDGDLLATESGSGPRFRRGRGYEDDRGVAEKAEAAARGIKISLFTRILLYIKMIFERESRQRDSKRE